MKDCYGKVLPLTADFARGLGVEQGESCARGGGGYSPKIPIRVCAAQRGRDFGTPYLERGIHFRDVS